MANLLCEKLYIAARKKNRMRLLLFLASNLIFYGIALFDSAANLFSALISEPLSVLEFLFVTFLLLSWLNARELNIALMQIIEQIEN